MVKTIKKKAVKKKAAKVAKKKSANTAKKTSKVAKKKTAKVAKKKTAKVAKKKASAKSSLLSRMAKGRNELEKARRKSEKSGEKLFKEVTREIFKSFPNLNQFSWQQYTPYWNDGDECMFSCNFDAVALHPGDKDYLWDLHHLNELFSGDLKKKRKKIEAEIQKTDKEWEKINLQSELRRLVETDPEKIREVKEKYETKKVIVDLLQGIDDSVYRSMFGEGEVTVTREGTSVSDCDHE